MFSGTENRVEAITAYSWSARRGLFRKYVDQALEPEQDGQAPLAHSPYSQLYSLYPFTQPFFG